MQEIIENFNKTFEGTAKAEIEDKQLKLTIGNETWTIELPRIVGASSKAVEKA